MSHHQGKRDEAGMTCRCGHVREAHEHYRRGTDCGICGRSECRAFRAAPSAATPSDADPIDNTPIAATPIDATPHRASRPTPLRRTS